MPVYEYATINSSPTIDLEIGKELGDARGKAVTFENGKVKIADAGEVPVGIVLLTQDSNLKTGDRVSVQIKDIGKWKAGEAVDVGTLLASDSEGLCKKAAEGQYVFARALSAATTKNDLIDVQIINAGYEKANV